MHLPVLQPIGECNRCGECCCSGDPFNGELGPAKIAGACPLFDRDKDGKGVCTDRTNSYYLGGCAKWPSHPDHIKPYPSCSYSF